MKDRKRLFTFPRGLVRFVVVSYLICFRYIRFTRLVYVGQIGTRFLEALFVDSVWLHRLWHCHRIPSRSFFIRGRQFHVCARCTGLIVGLILSPAFFWFRANAAPFFVAFLLANAIDSTTQFIGLRASENWLRMILGSALGLTFVPALLAVVT